MIKLLFRKIKHNTSLILVLLLLLFSCQNISSEDIYGKYSPISYKNSFDTLTINKDGTYNRRVYDRKKIKILPFALVIILERIAIKRSQLRKTDLKSSKTLSSFEYILYCTNKIKSRPKAWVAF